MLNMLNTIIHKKVIKPMFSISKLGRNIIQGRADSGLNIDHMYRKQPRGVTSAGKFLDSILLSLPTVKATRKKKEIITKILKNEIENNILLNKKTRILDLASGPARYLVDLLNNQKQEDVEVLCLDTDRRSLNFGKVLAGKSPIRYAKANLFSLGHLKRFAARVGWTPNIIMTTGFFEMQTDIIVQSFLKDIYYHLSKEGLILFTAQSSNPNTDLMKNIGSTQGGKKWEMFLRPPIQYRKWLLETGFRDAIISLDYLGMYEYCTGRKGR